MYAEIGEKDVEDLKPLLHEVRVYAVSRFMVTKNRRGYRPVKGDLMINFTCHTIIDEAEGYPEEFPELICDPVLFPELSNFVGEVSCFVGM